MDIEQLLDEKLAKEREEGSGDLGKFRASSFGRCYLAQVLNRKGEEMTNPPDAKSLRIFNVGTITHEYLQGLIPNNEEVCELEYEDDDFSGHCDYLGEDYVEDFKTVNVFKFNQVSKKGALIEDIYPQYIIQLMAYCIWWNKPKGKLTFVNKDDWRIKSFWFDVEDWRGTVQQEFDMLKAFWHRDSLPPAFPRVRYGKADECIYCGFKDRCGK